MPEKSNVINFRRGIELQDEKDQQNIEKIKEKITKLKAKIEQYREWQKIAQEQGDTENALLYEIKALEIEILIMEGEKLCQEADMIQIERWQKHFKHTSEMDQQLDSAEHLENIDVELENIKDYLELLSEDEADDATRQKIQALQEKRVKLEIERLKYSK